MSINAEEIRIEEKFTSMHSEIIRYFQCIEYDMKRIYSGMADADYDDSMDELEGKNWCVILSKLKRLDNSDGEPFLSEDEYKQLDSIRELRNYWCHQCYLDYVYISDRRARLEKMKSLCRRLENERNRVGKLHTKIQNIYFEYFSD